MDPKRPSPLRGSGLVQSCKVERKRAVSFKQQQFLSAFRSCLSKESQSVGRVDLLYSRNFALNYQLDSLMSKYSDGTSDAITKREAFRRFDIAEASCTLTNQRFSYKGRHHGEFDHEIHRAKVLCQEILGQRVPLDLIAANFGFGPGASTRLPRRKGDASYKYSGFPETTPGNLPYAWAALQHKDYWARQCSDTPFVIVHANKVTTVPKNTKTDRCIAIEPCMNMYVQKGFGAYIRDRLRLYGIDLNNQNRNQDLAYYAYSEGLATIDLSMASDTVATYLVRELLPPEWYEHLNNVRSHYGVLPSGETITYQKFSSMGNGFTFELESLLFYSLVCAVVPEELRHRVGIYGDDIILPSKYSNRLISLLSYCGFAVNEDKSFVDGPFYESCGKHYHEGHDVTPFYLRRPVKMVSDVYLLHNNIVRWTNRIAHLVTPNFLIEVSQLLRLLRRSVLAKYRLHIPDNYGDGGFVMPFRYIEYRRDANGWEFKTLRHYISIFNEVETSCTGLLIKALDRIAKRGDKIGYLDPLPIFPVDTLSPKYVKGSLSVPTDYYFHFDDLLSSYNTSTC